MAVIVVVAAATVAVAQTAQLNELEHKVASIDQDLRRVDDKFEKWLAAIFVPWRSYVDPALNDLKAWVGTLRTEVFDRLKPWIDTATATLNTVQSAVALANGRIDQLVHDVYGQLFPGLDAVRAQARQLSGDLQALAGLVDEKLAAKISEAEGRLLGRLDGVTRDLRDELLGRIHEATDPIARQVTELTSTVQRSVDGLSGRLNRLTGKLDGLADDALGLTRDALTANVGKWGPGLVDEFFKQTAPDLTDREHRDLFSVEGEPGTETAAAWISATADFFESFGDLWVKHLTTEVPVPDTEIEAAILVDPNDKTVLVGIPDARLQRVVRGLDQPPPTPRQAEEPAPEDFQHFPMILTPVVGVPHAGLPF